MVEKLSIDCLVTSPKPNHQPITGHLKYAHTCRIQIRPSLAIEIERILLRRIHEKVRSANIMHILEDA